MTNHRLHHLKVTSGSLHNILDRIALDISEGRNSYCIPINLTKYVVSKRDQKLTQSINNADLVIADGVPIRWLGKRAGLKNVHRVTGVDLSERLLAVAKDRGWSLYFLGASPKNLGQALEQVKRRFNDPLIAGARDGYFGEDDVPAIIQEINDCKPDILFLGLGMPQKEYFLHDHHNQLDVPFCITVGGAIDIWAEAKMRTPRMIQQLGLEWFVRSIYDVSKAKNIIRYGGAFLKELVFYKPPRHGSSQL